MIITSFLRVVYLTEESLHCVSYLYLYSSLVKLYSCSFHVDVDSQYTVTIVRAPAGTPVSGSTNTFDYPILSNVTLTCMVTSDDGSPVTVTGYSWDTTRCFTNNAHNVPACFPAGQRTQNVTGNNLLAEDAGTITCTAVISCGNFSSGSLRLRISGIHLKIVIL